MYACGRGAMVSEAMISASDRGAECEVVRSVGLWRALVHDVALS